MTATATAPAPVPATDARADRGDDAATAPYRLHSDPLALPLQPGEQYRFGVDLGRCIGCHACEVACAEQNDLPAGVYWRRVGDVEGGEFPHTSRLHVSTACNHCLEPACMHGCPTLAYSKGADGIVVHDAQACVGCGYCTWNCPYDVPVIDPVRRVATKCDLCKPRLDAGDLPACVEACPTGAIALEVVDVASWRGDHAGGEGPGLPPAALTLSTTRIAVPARAPRSLVAAGDHGVAPEAPHWPLVVVTLLTQVALGAVAATLMLPDGTAKTGAVAALLAGAAAMAASLLHLGRPERFLKAFRNVCRSWLSREVLGFSVFAAVSCAYAGAELLGLSTARAVGLAAVGVGTAGVYASARIYRVPARPAWDTWRTTAGFFLTAASTGPLLVLVLTPGAAARPAAVFAVVGLAGTVVLVQLHAAALVHSSTFEAAASGRLLLHRFRALLAARVGAALVAVAACAGLFAASEPSTRLAVLALVAAAAGELAGRYLFFVTVVGRRRPGNFFEQRGGHG